VRPLLSSVVLVLLIALVPVLGAALPPQVSPGTAVVDGQYMEWNLSADFFANMYRAGNPAKPLESKLYLRYDCRTCTMYVLVLVEPLIGGNIDSLETTSWIAIDVNSNKVANEVSGNDGTAPDFAWVGRGYDGNNQHVRGYEASFTISPGAYHILAHIEVIDGGIQTSATNSGFPHGGPALVVQGCPMATEPMSFGAIKALYR
jgi:hypothetical protein